MRSFVGLGLATTILLSATGLASAQQPPPTSPYPDGTGNVAVDSLNAGQLNQNYRGPWYPVPANRTRPAYAPGYAPPGYAPGYAPPAYRPLPYPQAAPPAGGNGYAY